MDLRKILADLKRERRHLNQAIAALEALRSSEHKQHKGVRRGRSGATKADQESGRRGAVVVFPAATVQPAVEKVYRSPKAES